MTDSKSDLLNQIATERDEFKDFVRAVDADLARERVARLAERRLEISTLIVRAYAKGATIAELKRAFRTKDYRTIRNIIDSRSAEVEALKAEAEAEVAPKEKPEFFFDKTSGILYAAGLEFHVTELEGQEYLLDWRGGNGEWGPEFDGDFVDRDSAGYPARQMYEAIVNAG